MLPRLRDLFFRVGYRIGGMPWDIGRPQPSLVALEAEGTIAGKVLDIGCGRGDIALHLAARGYDVTGIDISPAAIRDARRRCEERGLSASFAIADISALPEQGQRYDTLVDYGVLHQFHGAEERRYVETLRRLLAPGGRLVVQCFSAEGGSGSLPRRLSREHLEDLFLTGWRIAEIRRASYETTWWGAVPVWLCLIRPT